jgi:hypothetical protein
MAKAKTRRQTKGLVDNFHIDSDDDVKSEDEDVVSKTHSETSVSDHAALPKTQAAQYPKRSKSSPKDASSHSSSRFVVEDASKDEDASSELSEKDDAEYWARKARGELESGSGESDEEFSSTGDEFSSDSEMEMEDMDAEEYNEGVLQQELVYGEETHRIAVINCDWERIRAVDLLVVSSSFCPSTGLVKSVNIYPSDFGLSMMAEEDVNGPAIYKINNDDDDDSNFESDGRNYAGKEKQSEEQKAALDQIKLRRYELNKLRYYFAVITCDSIATASSLYGALDNQEIEMTSNKLDMRFVPDDISFESRQVYDVANEVPLNYEAPTSYTTVLQKTEAKLTWDQTPKDRLAVTQAAFSQLAEIDESRYSQLLASSSEGESDVEDNDDGRNGIKMPPSAADVELDQSRALKKKQRQKYASLLAGLDGLNSDEDGEGNDDFFSSSKKQSTVSGNVEFTIDGGDDTSKSKSKSNKKLLDVDAEIKRKMEEKLSQKPNRKLKATNYRSVVPKYRPDEKPNEEEEKKHFAAVISDDEEASNSEDSLPFPPSSKPGKSSKKDKDSSVMDVDDDGGGDDSEVKKDIWAGFEDAFEKPSKSKLAKLKKRKRDERETELKSDKQTRAELKLLLDKGEDNSSASSGSDEDGDEEQLGPKKKKSKRAKKDKKKKEEQRSDINLVDPRFGALMKDPRFMPDPTNPNFKKTAAAQAILDARKEYRKTHDSRLDDHEDEDGGVENHPSVTSSSLKLPLHKESSSQHQKKKIQKGFYDIGDVSKKSGGDSKMELDDLVASIKRKASTVPLNKK